MAPADGDDQCKFAPVVRAPQPMQWFDGPRRRHGFGAEVRHVRIKI